MHATGVIYLILGLIILCDEIFKNSLLEIAKTFGLSQDITGTCARCARCVRAMLTHAPTQERP